MPPLVSTLPSSGADKDLQSTPAGKIEERRKREERGNFNTEQGNDEGKI